MKLSKRIVIINNERISKNESNFFCDNIDMKSIPEGVDKNFLTTIIARKSLVGRSHKINLKRINIASNIFNFLLNIFKTFKHRETNYLLISITPYTFAAYLFLFLFRKKIFVYLRSNGHEEYKAILGFIGPLIYHFMYIIVTFKSEIIICQKRLSKNKKNHLVFPSQLDSNWLTNIAKPLLDKPRLLYVGRVKIEKGIFSLVKIFNEINIDMNLSIVGKEENLDTTNNKINFVGHGLNSNSLIKIYDSHNILILPSFTEAYPKVVNESLSRARPVIIFEEIGHIIQDRQGVFVSKRNSQSLLKIIEFIMSNYLTIQNNMRKNKLPNKQEFLSRINNILVKN